MSGPGSSLLRRHPALAARGNGKPLRMAPWAWALLCLLALQPAHAQPSCSLPPVIQPPDARQADYRNPNHPTDYLALVLSWSPEHCAKQDTPAKRAKHALQCSLNRFEFVVHGLWPQNARATSSRDHPRHCKDSAPLGVDLLRRHLCSVPGTDLMQNEWQAHGTCHWPSAEAYFTSIEALLAEFKRPAMEQFADAAARSSLARSSGARIKQAFVAANPGRLRRENLRVSVESGNRLKEVWICLSAQEPPTAVACPPGGTPDGQAVSVRAPAGGAPRPVEPIGPGHGDDFSCPSRQRRFGGYTSAAKSALWSQVYGDGGETVYCQAKFGAGQRQTQGGLPINIEHALPKSQVRVGAGQGDLHNLWPSIVQVNSARENFALTANIPGEDWTFAASPEPELAGCDFEVASIRTGRGRVMAVEPAPQARGRLARSILHMSLAYGVAMRDTERAMYLAWHEQFAPQDDERRRNDAIERAQGTRNPFIDSPAHARLLVESCAR